MTGEVALLDTDVTSALFRHRYHGRPLQHALNDGIDQYWPCVSVVTLGEAHYGAVKRKWGVQRTQRLLGFYRGAFVVLPVDEPVSDEYGRIRAATEALGRPRRGQRLMDRGYGHRQRRPVYQADVRHGL